MPLMHRRGFEFWRNHAANLLEGREQQTTYPADGRCWGATTSGFGVSGPHHLRSPVRAGWECGQSCNRHLAVDERKKKRETWGRRRRGEREPSGLPRGTAPLGCLNKFLKF